jgi:hypothetical protein
VRPLLYVAVACAAFCQDRPDCENAAQRLHSESATEKAWGAHLAAECRLPALAKEIGDELVRLQLESLARLTSDSEHYWMAYALLDALIQLRAPLDESVLASIVQGFPTEGVILSLQNPHVSAAFLAEVRASRPAASAEAVALSNALAAMRAPGFAATLLHEVQLTQWVWLSDSGDARMGGTAGSILGGILQLKVPSGLPSVGRYRLTSQPASQDEVFSDGATPIYLEHIIVEPGIERIPEWPPEAYCVQCLRIGYLAVLASLPATEVKRAIEPQISIRWSTLLGLNAEMSRALAEQIQAMNQLAKSLVSAGALLPAELELPLKIEVQINDQRKDQSPPIPAAGPVTFVIHP